MNSDSNGRNDPVPFHPSFDWKHRVIPMTGGEGAGQTVKEALNHPAYPLSSAYDPGWHIGNSMGPIATWLIEDLAPDMHFAPGQRVLDLGCGTAITSIFLAREYDVQVWAADLWIDPNDNAIRIAEAECDQSVIPLRAEAHNLPFAHGFFDAIISVDAYHYFGTDVRYLSYLAQFVKPGGRIGISVPGNATDPDDPDAVPLPQEFAEQLGADWYSFRSADWWHRHWSRTLCVDVELAEMVEGGRESWLRHSDAIEAYCPEAADFFADRPLLECEAGLGMSFSKVIARRNEKASLMFGPGEYATRIA